MHADARSAQLLAHRIVVPLELVGMPKRGGRGGFGGVVLCLLGLFNGVVGVVEWFTGCLLGHLSFVWGSDR